MYCRYNHIPFYVGKSNLWQPDKQPQFVPLVSFATVISFSLAERQTSSHVQKNTESVLVRHAAVLNHVLQLLDWLKEESQCL